MWREKDGKVVTVPFMLGGAWTKVVDGAPEEGVDDGLLEWSDDMGVDRGVHESIFDGVEAVGKDVVVAHDAHVARDGGRRLVGHSSG